ncbi:MAG TPA: 2-amino-4-hydroxy-6-hydroxymethyldihydropteridine diphosphokinase [Terriglobia bacterium]|nr:2-amino-4-hydroxy-6-hydroxymethyldihydropteridine diphosphokinase [Terriglobia bacterium]
MKRVYLSLGSNRGNRVAYLEKALGGLEAAGIVIRHVSSYYKTEPVDFQPQAWFVNCAVEAETDLMPLQLLRACQGIERALGRRRGVVKGPRPIDIDILLYENTVVHSTELIIPHPRLDERRFVLVPLREIAPGLCHPVSQRRVEEMLHDTEDRSQVVRMHQE